MINYALFSTLGESVFTIDDLHLFYRPTSYATQQRDLYNYIKHLEGLVELDEDHEVSSLEQHPLGWFYLKVLKLKIFKVSPVNNYSITHSADKTTVRNFDAEFISGL